MNPIVDTLGRRLRVAVIGGGEGAMIGGVHRIALRYDDYYDIAAGVLSSDPRRSVEQGRRAGLARPYGTLAELIEGERARADGVDIIAIMTPNDSHYAATLAALDAGFHVVCDKPMTATLDEALTVLDTVARTGLAYCVTYNYSGYPMVREMRARVAAGQIGRVHLVEVRFAQGNLSTLVEADPDTLSPQLRWRLDPRRGGANHLMMDTGVHAQHMVSYVTGLQFERVFADLGAALPGRRLADSAVILGRLTGDVRISLSITKAATGAPHVFGISVYGDRGGLEWEQGNAPQLRHLRQGQATEIIHRGMGEGLSGLARRSIRVPEPHPEGMREAFANIYRDFGDVVAARIAGIAPAADALTYPTGYDGARSLAFVDACAISADTGAWTAVRPVATGRSAAP